MGRRVRWRWAAVASACDLTLPRTGLRFSPCGLHDLPEVLKPVEDGSQMDTEGSVEVVSCLEVDGRTASVQRPEMGRLRGV